MCVCVCVCVCVYVVEKKNFLYSMFTEKDSIDIEAV